MTQIRAGLYGVCVADALGVPAESRTKADLKKNPITGMTSGGLHGQPAGFWSDDSSMTLCLAKSIGEVGYYHTHDIMERFNDWCVNGAYTPGGKKFDIGNTCAWAIDRYRKGVTPALCGSNKMNENGNGSLMRILPMAFVLYQKYGVQITESKRAMEDIHKISGLTHRHPLAQSGCGIYLAIAVRLLDGYSMKAAIQEGITAALNWYASHGKFADVVRFWKRIADVDAFLELDEDTIYSGGFVVESLETALWSLLITDNYADCVLHCVNMGYDTDSTAAIVGGLAGICYGYDAIPAEWIEQLAGKEIIDDCVRGMEEYIRSDSIMDAEHLRKQELEEIEARRRAREAFRDKIRGSLIGGAAGDALGYPVEFNSWKQIRKHYGEKGIQAYDLDFEAGEAIISDDTQMTLFTANGILYGDTRGRTRGIQGSVAGYVKNAYLDWYRAQNDPNMTEKSGVSWLYDLTEMHQRRAPGTTCMTALGTRNTGSVEFPCNDSKGCGGLMRVAPLALHYQPQNYAERLELDRDGAEIAAVTHGHPLGYIPAAMMTHIISIGVYGGCGRGDTLLDAVEESMSAMREIFPEQGAHLDELESLTRKAISLAAAGGEDEASIRALGQGWVADEALAIAVYCSLRYPNDFSKAIIAAVNHSGDSDSTGSMTGNILGAWLGYSAIEEKWLKGLEMETAILELADDLCYGCQMSEYGSYNDPIWECKYIYGRYARTEARALELIGAALR